MIKNEDELGLMQNQLALAERALKAIRDEVRPLNESRFLLMGESYVDMIHTLREQIDVYLGVETIANFQAELVLGLEGPGVQLGTSPGSLVTRVLDAFRRSLQSVVEAVESTGSPDRTVGRRKLWIEQLCDLPLVGIAPGSVQVRLGEPASLSAGLLESDARTFYKQVMWLLREGLACATGEVKAEAIPSGLRQAVLNAVRKIMPTERGVLDSITFSGRAMGVGKDYRVTKESRRRLDQEVRRVSETTEYSSVEGIIREVDLDKNTFVLRERPQSAPELLCEYAESDEEDVKSYLDKPVSVSGTIRTSGKSSRQMMEVEFIDLVGPDVGQDEPLADSTDPNANAG